MKQFLLILALGFLFSKYTTVAQQLSPSVVASAGNSVTDPANGARLSFTTGEAAIATLSQAGITCEQGFHHGFSPLVDVGELDPEVWDLRLFPSPVSQTLHLHFTTSAPDDYLDVAVWNSLGQALSPVIRMDALSEKTLDVAHLPNGIYLLQLSDRERRSTALRFVKIK